MKRPFMETLDDGGCATDDLPPYVIDLTPSARRACDEAASSPSVNDELALEDFRDMNLKSSGERCKDARMFIAEGVETIKVSKLR